MKSLAAFYKCPLSFPTKIWRVKFLEDSDGDTITVLVDRGWDDFATSIKEIRFASIDTWESKGDWPAEHLALGKKAKVLTTLLCAGRWAYLLTAMDPEMYGRILGDPFPMQDDGSFSDVVYELYKAGFQKTPSKYPYRGPTSGPRDIKSYLPRFGA